MTSEHPAPLALVGVKRIVGRSLYDIPRPGGDFSFELFASPTGVSRIDAHGARLGVGRISQIDESQSRHSGGHPVWRKRQADSHGWVDRAAVANGPRIHDTVGPFGQVIGYGLTRGAIEGDSDATILIVLNQQHNGAIEVRVEEYRGGHQKAAR